MLLARSCSIKGAEALHVPSDCHTWPERAWGVRLDSLTEGASHVCHQSQLPRYRPESHSRVDGEGRRDARPAARLQLPGFAGYYFVDVGNGVFTWLGLFETPEQAKESTKLVATWIRDEKLDRLMPNEPKITSGKVFARSSERVLVA